MWPLVSFLKNEIHLDEATAPNIWEVQNADVTITHASTNYSPLPQHVTWLWLHHRVYGMKLISH